MRRKLLIVASLLVTAAIAYGQKAKKDKEELALATTGQGVNYKELGSSLPPLKIYRRDGVYLTEKDLNNDAPLILMLFNPTCEHCEEETRQLKENIGLFNKTNLVLLAAPAMGAYLNYFVTNTGAEGVDKIQIGLDSSGYIDKTFIYKPLPQINIYDRNRKLVRIFNGDTPLDSLKPYIQ